MRLDVSSGAVLRWRPGSDVIGRDMRACRSRGCSLRLRFTSLDHGFQKLGVSPCNRVPAAFLLGPCPSPIAQRAAYRGTSGQQVQVFEEMFFFAGVNRSLQADVVGQLAEG